MKAKIILSLFIWTMANFGMAYGINFAKPGFQTEDSFTLISDSATINQNVCDGDYISEIMYRINKGVEIDSIKIEDLPPEVKYEFKKDSLIISGAPNLEDNDFLQGRKRFI
ncbi:MAG TPA: hypothetical protein ENN33_10365, partial [Ignavibacteria bacterium]|nr:hypothetical protein [Ignavibacteria bacterium]